MDSEILKWPQVIQRTYPQIQDRQLLSPFRYIFPQPLYICACTVTDITFSGNCTLFPNLYTKSIFWQTKADLNS